MLRQERVFRKPSSLSTNERFVEPAAHVRPSLAATGPGSRLKLCSSREGLALCVMG